MEAAHLPDHLRVHVAVDAAAEGFAAAAQAPAAGRGARPVRRELLEDGEGVDGAGVAREGDELQQGFVEPGRGLPRPQRRADRPAQGGFTPPGGLDRDARER